MKTNMRSEGLTLPILVALAFTLGIGLSTAFSAEGPKEFIGFGEGKAVPSITLNEIKGGTYEQKSAGGTVGNRFTFSFGATKDANGKVQGEMFIRDHVLNLTISSDVVQLVTHPKLRATVGVKAHGLDYAVRLQSSTS